MLFPQRDPTRVLRQIQLGDVRFSDEFELLPPRLQKVLRRALCRNPSRRCSDAKSFKESLVDVSRSSLKNYNPTSTRKELGILTRTLMDPTFTESEDVRLPTNLLEQEDKEASRKPQSISSSYRIADSTWARFCAYACALLVVLALLLEVLGMDLRPKKAPPAVLTPAPVQVGANFRASTRNKALRSKASKVRKSSKNQKKK